MNHPLDNSDPARKLLVMAAREMAQKIKLRIELEGDDGDDYAQDDVLRLTVGVDVMPGRSCFTAMQHNEDGTSTVLDYGRLE